MISLLWLGVDSLGKKGIVKNRIICQMSDELLAELDDYAEKSGISRSSAISVLVSEQLFQKKAMKDLSDIVKLSNQLSNSKLQHQSNCIEND